MLDTMGKGGAPLLLNVRSCLARAVPCLLNGGSWHAPTESPDISHILQSMLVGVPHSIERMNALRREKFANCVVACKYMSVQDVAPSEITL